jgi:hypothetical protein
MFLSFWRRLRNRKPSEGRRLRAEQSPSCRPWLEALEHRLSPAAWPGTSSLAPGPAYGAAVPHALEGMAPAPPAAVSGLRPVAGPAPAPADQMRVTVNQNSPATAIDLGPVFRAMSGIHPEDGLRLSLLGNTNARLVTTDLCETELTLTYARGQCGTATITVAATDADGVSVREALLVTVLPLLKSAGA